jgi:hypothetical protein
MLFYIKGLSLNKKTGICLQSLLTSITAWVRYLQLKWGIPYPSTTEDDYAAFNDYLDARDRGHWLCVSMLHYLRPDLTR